MVSFPRRVFELAASNITPDVEVEQRHGKTGGHDSLERQRALRDVIAIKTSPVTIRNYYTDTLRWD